MLLFFLVTGSLLFAFVLYSRKFRNPYKLTFIFGKKGSGKSTLMVNWMLRDLRRGWNVYTDIQDVVIPGVRIIDSSSLLADFVPEPNSSVYLDEVGISFDNRNYKSFPPGLRDFFKLQRKYRCKVTMNSQSFDVDKKIRDTTDSMILTVNIGNVICIARPIIRTITLTKASSESDSRIADELRFAPFWRWKFYWMPRYFKWFKSFNAPYRDFIDFRPAVPDDPLLEEAIEVMDNE